MRAQKHLHLIFVSREAITNETVRVGKKFPTSQKISDTVEDILKKLFKSSFSFSSLYLKTTCFNLGIACKASMGISLEVCKLTILNWHQSTIFFKSKCKSPLIFTGLSWSSLANPEKLGTISITSLWNWDPTLTVLN